MRLKIYSLISKVISGGQTGVDFAGLEAAYYCHIPTGGTAPRGWLTEDGPNLELGGRFGLHESKYTDYKERTITNIKDSDLTILIADKLTGGSRVTAIYCKQYNKPCLWVKPNDFENKAVLQNTADRIYSLRLKRLLIVNIAGHRESKHPGIGRASKEFLIRLFES